MGVSRRRYASMRGVSDMAVRKAIASGRISVEADGTIDPAKADAQWDSQTDPAKQRGVHAQTLGARTAASTARAAATKPVPKAAIDAVNATLGDTSAEVGTGSGGEVSFLRARMANEVLKAQTARVRLEKMKGELVDRARATNSVFDLARRERDAWLNWPPRVAANMAAELGVEAHALEQVLDRFLRAHLVDMAEVKIDLR
ncbi:elements of external origin [Paracoccus aurantiacus]|uniref:Elements of external origin n=1 Tax=Paracoccus aurantiacus TaxID=2599412 RepID=A0A5C6RUL5_9RHOB|nr:elements of external origin [Paracoccus aurantiacus]TXB65704.1 elements of external origin [Paracoccus aurantiacus]